MTILNPTKKEKRAYFGFITKLFLLVILGGVIWIYQYNQVAESRYEVRHIEQKIAELEVENAELKNELFQATNPSKLETVALSKGLVKEDNPDYLELTQWVSDSSY